MYICRGVRIFVPSIRLLISALYMYMFAYLYHLQSSLLMRFLHFSLLISSLTYLFL